ncbi:cation transporter dimerization domain-containing protein [Janthinobacterium sp. PC23-8]|uniref:cation transporter dimerization domain-containing protein n=1 Tax=Janthinobacterium sp. PC23-8 TaxID=2012679 RepID=UPI000B977135|nr:cation transporter dimerization domain-containing protein [Janthinobacterium sp. PC23-8]OYO28766.1 hypothetical protein CD932_16570 [Janthinobacterium sp. PC23-8]
MPNKHNEKRRHHIPKMKFKVTNWAEYDAGPTIDMGDAFQVTPLLDQIDARIGEIEFSAILETLLKTHGVNGMHDLRTRKMEDMNIADVHLEVEASLTVEAGHDIAVDARRRVLERHPVFNLMAHIDLWRRPDLDHESELRPCSLERAG